MGGAAAALLALVAAGTASSLRASGAGPDVSVLTSRPSRAWGSPVDATYSAPGGWTTEGYWSGAEVPPTTAVCPRLNILGARPG